MKHIIIHVLLIYTGLQAYSQSQNHNIPDGKSEPPSTYIHFMENKGQFSDQNNNPVPDVRYGYIQNRIQGYASKNGRFSFVTYQPDTTPNDSISNDSLYRQDMTLVNSVEGVITPVEADPIAEEQVEGIYNFYLPVCPNGVTDVLSYKRIVYEDVYTDIDYHLYSNQTGLKIYFVIKPGADPDDIRMQFEGQDLQDVSSTEVDLFMGSVQLTLESAIAYQLNNQNQVVSITSWTPGYVENSDGTVSLTTGSYNTSQTLVIQIAHPLLPALPQAGHNPNHLEWSSYVSGSGTDTPFEVFNDELGNAYYAMETSSSIFSNIPGKIVHQGSFDGYAAKFNHEGKAIWGSFIGGSDYDGFTCGVATANGITYWAGNSNSSTLIGTIGQSNPGQYSGFVVGMNGSGKMFGEPKFLGGEKGDFVRAIDHNGNGRIAIVGYTESTDTIAATAFPITSPNTLAYVQNTNAGNGDGFVMELNDSLKILANPIEYCTFFGGDEFDYFTDVEYDSSGNLLVAGVTLSRNSTNTCNVPSTGNLPLCNPTSSLYSQPFAGSTNDYYMFSLGTNRELTWSTYLGSASFDGNKIDFVIDDANDDIYIAATTRDPLTFPSASTSLGFNWTPSNGSSTSIEQLAILRLNAKSSFTWSTYIGCDSNKSTNPDIAMSDDFIYLSFQTTCKKGESSSTYCMPPVAGSNEMVICDNSGDLWLQDLGTGVVFKGSDQTVVASFQKSNNSLRWSTPYGGTKGHENQSISYDKYKDRVYIAGATTSLNDIPLKQLPDPKSHFQSSIVNSMSGGGYIARFAANLNNISVEEVKSDNNWNVKVYPNPTRDLLFIEIEKEEVSYTVVDIQGRIIKSGNLSEYTNSISLGELSSGSYLIQLKMADKSAVVKVLKE